MNLKLSIGNRLFFAILFAMLAVATIAMQLVRWRLFDDVAEDPANAELDDIGGLSDTLMATYRQRLDWSFLPLDSSRREIFLREVLQRLQDGRDARHGARTASSTLGYRVGLLDKDERYLAGVIANPIMIAFASIDTIRQPLVADGELIGYLIVIKPQQVDEGLTVAFLVGQQKNILVIAVIGVLLSALAAACLALHFRKPIGRLVDAARRLEDGHFDTRLNLRRSDELGVLADTFNHLSARLQDIEIARRQWVADTSHELRTPLSVLRGQIESLQDGIRSATPENIAVMLRQILSLTKVVDELYELACADVGQLSYYKCSNDAWRIVTEKFDDFSQKFRAAQLVATIGEPPIRSTVNCDPDRIRRVVTNLLENSVRYTAAGGCIHVSGAAVDSALRITIDDSAPGVPEQSIRRLGERFFRVEASRSRRHGGAGLGLALCRQILEAHDGQLEFSTSPYGGLQATVVLTLEDPK